MQGCREGGWSDYVREEVAEVPGRGDVAVGDK